VRWIFSPLGDGITELGGTRAPAGTPAMGRAQRFSWAFRARKPGDGRRHVLQSEGFPGLNWVIFRFFQYVICCVGHRGCVMEW